MSSRSHSNPSPLLIERARQLRSATTPTEQLLWQALRGGQLGVVFRRQVPLGRYIAGFYAPAARLVVEVDGGWHGGRRAADRRRDEWMRRRGYRVIRLSAALVQSNPGAAAERIRDGLMA